MKAKWHISALILIFTILGVANHQQVPAPNQEIILQFSELEASKIQVKSTIAIVKKQLQSIGVQNFIIKKTGVGNYKIAYYSNTNVASVKKILSEENLLALAVVSKEKHKKPSKKQDSSYNLDVFEIQKQEPNTGFGGTCALEFKYDYNRFFIPMASVSTHGFDVKIKEHFEKEVSKFRKNSAIAIDNTSHKIPEVRAGPNC